MPIKKENKTSNFSKISIGLASPEEILENSSGEVLKPETINYRTYKPERDGLFCERIFGPVKDFECHCGKYKRIRYKGIVCDRCGVEVTEKKVRRERMGHISLVVPVVHIWYFRSLPSKIGYLLGIPTKMLDAVIYYERYIVVQPGAAAELGVSEKDLLAEKEYLDILAQLPKGNAQLDDDDPNKFIALMGAEAIDLMLRRLDLDTLSYSLRHKASTETSQQRKAEARAERRYEDDRQYRRNRDERDDRRQGGKRIHRKEIRVIHDERGEDAKRYDRRMEAKYGDSGRRGGHGERHDKHAGERQGKPYRKHAKIRKAPFRSR